MFHILIMAGNQTGNDIILHKEKCEVTRKIIILFI
jgi:hypothetical protein